MFNPFMPSQHSKKRDNRNMTKAGLKMQVAGLAGFGLLAFPAAARACLVCNQPALDILPILLTFIGFGALGLGCLLAYSLIYTNKSNVEQPARDMLESEFQYDIWGVP